MKQIVQNYKFSNEINTLQFKPRGTSLSPKGMIFHITNNTQEEIKILDIGFGEGNLGKLVKSNPKTQHWIIDGIDGWEINCRNTDLFQKKIYRNIYYGLAQEIPSDIFKEYKIICLLDVIEHLDAETSKWLLRSLLTSMDQESYLFISTPLWFYPQNSIDDGDLEEHLIGVPATSMMALMPVMHAVNHPLIGGFVLSKDSLEFIDFFQPTSRKDFTYEKGIRIAKAIKMGMEPNKLYIHKK